MTNTNSAARNVLLVISLAITSLAFLSKSVPAQTTSTWSGGAGNWSDCPPGGNALWSTCPDPPQGLGWPDGNFNVVINGGPVNATSASIVNLSIGSGGSLLFPTGTSSLLDITGTSIMNNGSIVIDSSNGLGIQGPTSLTISGTGSISIANSRFNNEPGATSTVTLQQPISGNGAFALGMNLINQSTINATGGTLTMQPSSVVNTGTFEASSGGTLFFAPGFSVNFNNTGGTIEALNGGIVQLDGSTFTGGTITTVGSGVVQPSGSVLNSLTNSGTIQAGTTTVLEGTITNTGKIEVSSATLDMDGSTTVTGSGSIVLSGSAVLGQYTGSDSLINKQLLEGAGTIFELPLTNQGTINANSKGDTLYLVNGISTNTSVMEASSGGILDVETALNNTGGTIEAQTGSTVIIGGNSTATISGGTLTTNGTGVIESENAVLDGTVNIPTNAGNLEAIDGNDLYIQGTINNAGTITLSSTCFVILNENSTLTGSGKLVMGSNSAILGSGLAFTNQSTIEGTGTIERAEITNSGTILANSTSPLAIEPDSSGFTNTGKLTVNSGSTLTVEAPFNSLSEAGTLSSGTYTVTGTLGLPGAIVSNAANITLTGASAEILNTITSTNGLAAIASNATTGTLSLQSGQSLTTTTAVTNAGKVTVGAPSTFKVGGRYTQTAGTTTVDGTLTAPSGITLQKGSLVGKGAVAAVVTSTAATVTAGDSSTKPGTLTISGSYTQQAKGVLDIYVGGTTAGTFGDLAVSNGISLGGTLTIKLVNGFVPVVGDSFTILTGSAVSGTFATVNGTSINSGEHFEVSYTGTAVTLTVVSGT
jgi:fibronectin-binding autotransporter adhesin